MATFLEKLNKTGQDTTLSKKLKIPQKFQESPH